MGVDYAVKFVQAGDDIVKLQIVILMILSGTQQDRRDLEHFPLVTIVGLMALLLYMTSLTEPHSSTLNPGGEKCHEKPIKMCQLCWWGTRMIWDQLEW